MSEAWRAERGGCRDEVGGRDGEQLLQGAVVVDADDPQVGADVGPSLAASAARAAREHWPHGDPVAALKRRSRRIGLLDDRRELVAHDPGAAARCANRRARRGTGEGRIRRSRPSRPAPASVRGRAGQVPDARRGAPSAGRPSRRPSRRHLGASVRKAVTTSATEIGLLVIQGVSALGQHPQLGAIDRRGIRLAVSDGAPRCRPPG